LPLQLSCATLFTYTTLFRSRLVELPHAHRVLGRGTFAADVRITFVHGNWHDLEIELRRPEAVEAQLFLAEETAPLKLAEIEKTQDRKSTRLNSSHVKISYAV